MKNKKKTVTIIAIIGIGLAIIGGIGFYTCYHTWNAATCTRPRNDRMLSKDALEINHQASCKGYKISTCYVSDKGEMLSGFGSQRENKLQKEPEVIVKEVVKIIEVPKKESNLKVSQILVPVTTFMAGAAIGKYGNILFKYFKTAA